MSVCPSVCSLKNTISVEQANLNSADVSSGVYRRYCVSGRAGYLAGRQADRQAGSRTGRQAGGQASRQAD